jgi:glycosyltransferase involved in cell wall biosynthesis
MNGEVANQRPMFSVVIPIHNRAHQIGDCLSSVLAQRDVVLEAILVDNNSTDDLAGALRRFTDPRIRLIKCTRPGASAARNAGVRAARGAFISFVDSDDVWRADVLRTALPFMEKGAAAVYLRHIEVADVKDLPWHDLQEEVRKVCELEDFGASFAAGVWGTCALCAVRRNVIAGEHQFNEDVVVTEDLDWALRHVEAGPVALLDDEPRLGYRVHPGSITKNGEAYLRGTMQIINNVERGVYRLAGRPAARRRLVRNLIGSLVYIVRDSGWRAGLKTYLRVARIAISWGQLDLLFFPEQLPSVFKSRLRRLRGRRPPDKVA